MERQHFLHVIQMKSQTVEHFVFCCFVQNNASDNLFTYIFTEESCTVVLTVVSSPSDESHHQATTCSNSAVRATRELPAEESSSTLKLDKQPNSVKRDVDEVIVHQPLLSRLFSPRSVKRDLCRDSISAVQPCKVLLKLYI